MDRWKIGGGPIFLTLQSPNMISVIEPVLWLHLLITGLEKFVIFIHITGFYRRGFSNIFSINHRSSLFSSPHKWSHRLKIMSLALTHTP